MFAIILDWEDFKVWLSASTYLTHHDIHLILGVILTLGFGRVLRYPLGSWLPWLIVLGLELINETFDYIRYLVPGWPWTPKESLIDIAITMLPVLPILLVERWNSRYFYHFQRRQRFVVSIKPSYGDS